MMPLGIIRDVSGFYTRRYNVLSDNVLSDDGKISEGTFLCYTTT
jgi:hypothetical protein